MKETIRKMVSAVMAAMVLTGIAGSTAFAETAETENSAQLSAVAANTPEMYVNFNFDTTGGPNQWANEKYSRSNRTIETDPETGNRFIRFTYNTENTDAPLYSEDTYPDTGAYSTLSIKGNIVMSFDVRFGDNDGTIYLKERKPSVNNIVLRVGTRSDGRLVYGNSNSVSFFMDKNQNYFYVQDNWDNVQIIANITEDENLAKQSIYVTDKLTGELETKVENVSVNKAVSECNVVTVGTSRYVDLDNLIIEEPDIQDMRIVGNPYPVCGTRNTYTVRSLSKSGVALFRNDATPTWSLLNAVDGVAIDPVTGVLTAAYYASLSPVVIKADATIDGASKTHYYLVEIEK